MAIDQLDRGSNPGNKAQGQSGLQDRWPPAGGETSRVGDHVTPGPGRRKTIESQVPKRAAFRGSDLLRAGHTDVMHKLQKGSVAQSRTDDEQRDWRPRSIRSSPS